MAPKRKVNELEASTGPKQEEEPLPTRRDTLTQASKKKRFKANTATEETEDIDATVHDTRTTAAGQHGGRAAFSANVGRKMVPRPEPSERQQTDKVNVLQEQVVDFPEKSRKRRQTRDGDIEAPHPKRLKKTSLAPLPAPTKRASIRPKHPKTSLIGREAFNVEHQGYRRGEIEFHREEDARPITWAVKYTAVPERGDILFSSHDNMMR